MTNFSVVNGLIFPKDCSIAPLLGNFDDIDWEVFDTSASLDGDHRLSPMEDLSNAVSRCARDDGIIDGAGPWIDKGLMEVRHGMYVRHTKVSAEDRHLYFQYLWWVEMRDARDHMMIGRAYWMDGERFDQQATGNAWRGRADLSSHVVASTSESGKKRLAVLAALLCD